MADESGAPSSLAGVWDRFMTPGLKVQSRIDPETGEEAPVEYDFSAETFAQMVQNFSRTFSERRLSLDLGNHIAAGEHTQPVELARYSGLAAILDGKVIAFWDQFPDLPAPDPAALLSQLRQKFPRATSADGVWGYRRDVTPAGEKLLPNMHQISPFFSMEDKDEEGKPIGANINNVSPVYVAHQNGTVLMSKSARAAMGQPSSATHAPRPLGEEDTMADKPEDKKDPKDAAAPGGISPEMRKFACAKFSLPEGSSDNEIMTAYFVADGIANPKKPDGQMDVDPDNKAQNAAIHLKTGNVHDVASKFSDLPNEEIPGDETAKPNAQTNFGKGGNEILAALGKRTAAAEKAAAAAQARLDAIEGEKAEAEFTTFAKWAVDEEGRWPEGDHAGCVTFAKKLGVEEARKHIEQHMPPRAAFRRHTQGGHPVGTAALKSGSGDKAAAFSKRTGEIYKEISSTFANKNLAYAAAQQRAKAEMPDEYAAYSGRS